ncbi:MAG: methionyl-tRNA formyltransferase [Christensenellaceae bacterium]|jgi:methionyl-tRNA formyltransferase|nr:methionyl-tRNA formyltransferase [Christensenellaceae bacterium]
MKIIFLGTPQFAVNILAKLIKTQHKVLAVVTQPDKPCGRGHKVEMPPIKPLALSNNIPIHQFKSITKEGDILKEYNADIVITAAFGQILRSNVLEMCPYGVINVHASLLPKYRGSCPVPWSILHGETKTGVTIMKTEAGIDTGDMILTKQTDILPDENADELLERLSHIGADALIETLDNIEKGTAKYVPQDHSQMTYFPMLNKDMGKIDFNKTADEIINLIRGLNPWPAAFVLDGETRIKIYNGAAAKCNDKQPNGTIISADDKNGLVVKCSGGAVSLDIIQAPNSKKMNAKDYLRGNRLSSVKFE